MPRFIRPIDRENEQYVAREIEKHLGATVHTTDDMDGLDFRIFAGGRLSAIGELKCRNVAACRYPTIYLSKRKADCLLETGKELGAKPLFFVMFENRDIRYVCVDELTLGEPKNLGRFDRGAVNDVEPMYEVPTSRFKRLADARHH